MSAEPDPRAPGGPGAEPDAAADPRSHDVALLRAHVAGDPDAFADLVRRHRDRLWAVALRTLGDPEEAADALQDALLSAFRRAETFRGDAAVTTWLHRIVVNACLDRVRRRAARPADALPDDPDREPADAATPDLADASATGLDVAAALATLPADQRAALVLVDLNGFPVADAAEILGCPVGTVKSRCARARARMAPLLAHLVGGPDGVGDRPATGGTGRGRPTVAPPAERVGPVTGPRTGVIERPALGASGVAAARGGPADGDGGVLR